MDKELLESLIYVINSLNNIGFFKFIVLLSLVLYAVPIGRTIYKFVDFLLSYQDKAKIIKEKELEILATKAEKEEKLRMYDNFSKAIEQVREHNKLVDSIFRSLQLSPSNHKYEILLESFLGIDRSFNNDIKSKLFNYLETNKKDKFIYVRKDIINSFRDKVFTRLSIFIFKDKEYFDTIAAVTIKKLDEFLDDFEKIEDIEEAKDFLDDIEKGTIPLLQKLQVEIIEGYYKRFGADQYTDYLKRREG